jgi:hypothetical protein
VNPDSLTRANASLHRGARWAVAIVLPLGAAALFFALTRGFKATRLADAVHLPTAVWVLAALAVGVVIWVLREAHRLRSTQLTQEGIERGAEVTVRWAEVAVAEYGRGWLRFQDRAGRRIMFSLAFAASAHDVVEAIQDHLPAGVRLRVY